MSIKWEPRGADGWDARLGYGMHLSVRHLYQTISGMDWYYVIAISKAATIPRATADDAKATAIAMAHRQLTEALNVIGPVVPCDAIEPETAEI